MSGVRAAFCAPSLFARGKHSVRRHASARPARWASDSRCAVESSAGDATRHAASEGERPDVHRYSASKADRLRARPLQAYTEQFITPVAVSLDVIGVVRSPYKERFGTPRQAVVTEQTLHGCAQPAYIELCGDPARMGLALRGLERFELCWVVSYMHLNQQGWNALVQPPRGPRQKQGVFATRSPHRPNPIALSALRISRIDADARQIHVLGIDLLDGTPVLDIKPYVPYSDAFPSAAAGTSLILHSSALHVLQRKREMERC